MLDLDFGPCRPLHFVVEGELHLALEGICLHRTKERAPCDETAVTPAAAFICHCSTARLIDAIVVGDWLLHHQHMTESELVTPALADHGVPYLEVTKESLSRPKTLVGTVYRKLVSLGYDGPVPDFGDRWIALFGPVRDLLPPRRTRLRGLAARR